MMELGERQHSLSLDSPICQCFVKNLSRIDRNEVNDEFPLKGGDR